MPDISRFFGIVRIRAVEPLEGFRLRLHLTNDAVIERDVRPLMNGQIFEELIQDSQRFREVCAEGGTVVWSNGADLCPDVLIWGGHRLSPPNRFPHLCPLQGPTPSPLGIPGTP